jgi:hypothetical protein
VTREKEFEFYQNPEEYNNDPTKAMHKRRFGCRQKK